jgi:hypothetical protein
MNDPFSLMSGFRRDVDEICALLGYYAASCGNCLPTFYYFKFHFFCDFYSYMFIFILLIVLFLLLLFLFISIVIYNSLFVINTFVYLVYFPFLLLLHSIRFSPIILTLLHRQRLATMRPVLAEVSH